MLTTLIIDISQFNEDDSIDKFRANTSLNVLTEFDDALCTNESFLITDNRTTADTAISENIGFAAYLSDDKITDDKVTNEFPDSLYLITSLCELTDETIIRMYQRANDIPWTILETERVLVREMTVSDLEDLYIIYSDDETVKYIENLYENKQKEQWFTDTYIKNQYRYFEYGLWSVILKPDNKLIGRAGIFNRDGFEDVELGFVFDRVMWGVGIAYETCSAIIEYANKEFGFEKFIAFTKAENIRGKRLLERLGFVYKRVQTLNQLQGDEPFDMYELTLPHLYAAL